MRRKILIIDDEPTIRAILTSFLIKTHDVVARNDGQQALEWLEGNIPDLVICDIQMQPMNGYEFLKRFRQRGYTKHTPVIMLSSEESSSNRVECYQRGAQDFLCKPFNPLELLALIDKNLNPVNFAHRW